MNIDVASHLPLKHSGGGMFTVTWNIYHELQKHFDLRLLPVINAAPRYGNAYWSKFRRKVLRQPGTFFQFSKQVLDSNAEAVVRSVRPDCDALFFRSVTRWSMCRPAIPYFVHTDIVFPTFVQNTFQPGEFLRSDLERICAAEREFLIGAEAVFFESQWGLEKASAAYGIDDRNMLVTHNGSNLSPPDSESYDPASRKIVTIAKDFRQKGGDIVDGAYRLLKAAYPKLTWSIIGGKPPAQVLSNEGVRWEGFLNPAVPVENARFRSILNDAFLLIHPTREDTNPLVLVEAAGFGCPCISVNDFAIPELVINGETGVLLERPVSSEALANTISSLINDRNRYLAMRTAARCIAISHFDWGKTGEKIANRIRQTVALPSP